ESLFLGCAQKLLALSHLCTPNLCQSSSCATAHQHLCHSDRIVCMQGSRNVLYSRASLVIRLLFLRCKINLDWFDYRLCKTTVGYCVLYQIFLDWWSHRQYRLLFWIALIYRGGKTKDRLLRIFYNDVKYAVKSDS